MPFVCHFVSSVSFNAGVGEANPTCKGSPLVAIITVRCYCGFMTKIYFTFQEETSETSSSNLGLQNGRWWFPVGSSRGSITGPFMADSCQTITCAVIGVVYAICLTNRLTNPAIRDGMANLAVSPVSLLATKSSSRHRNADGDAIGGGGLAFPNGISSGDFNDVLDLAGQILAD